MMIRSFILIAIVVFTAGCQQPEADVTATAPEPAPTETQPARAEPIVLSDGFSTPESVLYDAEQDVYLVSNVNGSPVERDGNGFISRVNPETLQVEAKWIEGGRNSAQLDAPKGMAIVGDELWVSDITFIRKFDRRTGAWRSSQEIKGTTFLNDLASDENNVYVSDSGMKMEGGNFVGTNTDSIWLVTGTQSRRYASGMDLNRPNGLAVSGGKVWAVAFAGSELYDIANGKKGQVTTLPAGGLDGFVAIPDGSFLVSSWDGKAVYRGTPGGTFQPVLQNVESPADIGFDSKRNRILVPHFMENRVSIHPLE
jgi:sugar lactone lactonase YvrE